MELPQRKPKLSALVGDDAHIVPKPCGQIAEKYIRNVPEIKKYVIMPDHIHMIIRLDGGAMWELPPTDAKPRHGMNTVGTPLPGCPHGTSTNAEGHPGTGVPTNL